MLHIIPNLTGLNHLSFIFFESTIPISYKKYTGMAKSIWEMISGGVKIAPNTNENAKK